MSSRRINRKPSRPAIRMRALTSKGLMIEPRLVKSHWTRDGTYGSIGTRRLTDSRRLSKHGPAREGTTMSAIDRTLTFCTARWTWEATIRPNTVTTSGTPGRTFSTTSASLSET